MKSKNTTTDNFLEKIPVYKVGLNWSADEEGAITLEVENTGIANRIAQKILKKPRISYIHLDSMGNFIWPLIDGKRNIIAIGELVREHFGDKAEPLYPRLSQYFKILESNNFVEFVMRNE